MEYIIKLAALIIVLEFIVWMFLQITEIVRLKLKFRKIRKMTTPQFMEWLKKNDPKFYQILKGGNDE
jgi:hypothetical protein